MTVSSSSLVHAPLGTERCVVFWTPASVGGSGPGMADIWSAACTPGVVPRGATGVCTRRKEHGD
jgi:hypothetical protein